MRAERSQRAVAATRVSSAGPRDRGRARLALGRRGARWYGVRAEAPRGAPRDAAESRKAHPVRRGRAVRNDRRGRSAAQAAGAGERAPRRHGLGDRRGREGACGARGGVGTGRPGRPRGHRRSASRRRLRRVLGASGLSDRVAVVGRVQSADFGAHLRAMDVLVVPSTAYESMPLGHPRGDGSGQARLRIPAVGHSGSGRRRDDRAPLRARRGGTARGTPTPGDRDARRAGEHGKARPRAVAGDVLNGRDDGLDVDLYERLVGRTKVIKR